MKTWLIVLAIVLGVILGIQVFTAEGAPSAPVIQSSTSLNGGVQTFSFTFTSTAYGSQPINSIDEQGAKVLYSVYQNGHPISTGQSVALGIVGQSGFVYTLQAQASVGLPAVCSGSACPGVVENVSICAKAILPAWTGVYASSWVNVTFSTVASYQTVQNLHPATPLGTFALNFFGAIAALAAIELTIALAFWKQPAVVAGAVISWGVFALLVVVSFTVP